MAIEHILPSDIEALQFELENIPLSSKPAHYINNKELQEEFVKYNKLKKEWIEAGKEGNPPLTNKIGQAILDIATRRTYSRNFVGYSQDWKEEMIGDAIEVCVRYAHNYNSDKYNNPFAYLTQIVSFAIVTRIKKEKKNLYIKYKAFDNAGGMQAILDENADPDMVQHFNETSDVYADHLRYIADFEEKNKPEKKEIDVDEEDLGVLKFTD
jgi:hypothetical protein